MKKTVTYVLVTLSAFAIGMGGVYLLKHLGHSDKSAESQDTAQSLSTVNNEVEKEFKKASSAELPVNDEGQDIVDDMTDNRTSAGTAVEGGSDDSPTVARSIEVDGREIEIHKLSDDYFSISGLRALNVSSSGARFVLSDSEKHYYKSEDGNFPRVAANSRGYYAVAAIDNATGAKSKTITIKTQKKKDNGPYMPDNSPGSGSAEVARLTAAELSALFNQGDASVLKSVYNRFANYKTCKVQSNIPGVTTLSGVCMQVNMEGKHAVVNNLNYDKYGRVTVVNVSLE